MGLCKGLLATATSPPVNREVQLLSELNMYLWKLQAFEPRAVPFAMIQSKPVLPIQTKIASKCMESTSTDYLIPTEYTPRFSVRICNYWRYKAYNTVKFVYMVFPST